MDGSLPSTVPRDRRSRLHPSKTERVAEKLSPAALASLKHTELTKAVTKFCEEYGCTPEQLMNVAQDFFRGEKSRQLF